MKLCLTILLTSFLSIETYGFRVKRGLSADEQKKFLEELNKDRKKIAEEVGFKFVPMKYNASLEKEIVSGKKCLKNRVLPLRYNDVAEQYRERTIGMGKLGGADGRHLSILSYSSTIHWTTTTEVSMKLCLAILLTSFLSIKAHGSPVKRGLSADEQKKFLEELNKDRKKVAQKEGFDYVPVKYDASKNLLPLQYNDVAEQLRKHDIDIDGTEGDIYQYYFHQSYDKIGCSKEFKCTEVLGVTDIPLELQGKTIEYHGVCVQGKSNPEAKPMKLNKAKTPSPNNYSSTIHWTTTTEVSMKLCLAILLVSFICIEAYGSRVKPGLSADEQKKFLEELNKDRKRVAQEEGLEFVTMEYDASLEKEIVSSNNCWVTKSMLPLRINDVGEEIRNLRMSTHEGDIYQRYFHPIYDKIGCSKEAKCTELLVNKKEEEVTPNLVGKTVEYHGLCVVGRSDPDGKTKYLLKKAKTPSPNKYADILGIPTGKQESTIEGSGTDETNGKQGSEVEISGKNGADGEQGSGAGSVFSLTIFLFLEVEKYEDNIVEKRQKSCQDPKLNFCSES
ncbi:unnamed protein product [Caenorhabditis brenneri]